MRVFLLLLVLVRAAFAADAPALVGPVLPTTGEMPRATGGLRDFSDEIERDFTLRSIGRLEIANMRGNITVQGWALDRVRVKAKRYVRAASQTEAKRLLAAVDFRYEASQGDIELSAEYGRGLEIQERLQERADPRTRMEMVVYAPANLRLRVWAVAGSVALKSWNSDVEIRTADGPIDVDSVKSGNVSLLCPSCAIRVHGVRGSVRCMGGAGSIAISDVKGPQIYAETDGGPLSVSSVVGEQLYVSQSGGVSGKNLNGRIEFHTRDAPVEISDSSGFLSGRTDSGRITAAMRDWTFLDRALIETGQGSIRLALPGSFAGDVDVWSRTGKMQLGFPLAQVESTQNPVSSHRAIGRIGDGGGALKIYSDSGDIDLERLPSDSSP